MPKRRAARLVVASPQFAAVFSAVMLQEDVRGAAGVPLIWETLGSAKTRADDEGMLD